MLKSTCMLATLGHTCWPCWSIHPAEAAHAHFCTAATHALLHRSPLTSCSAATGPDMAARQARVYASTCKKSTVHQLLARQFSCRLVARQFRAAWQNLAHAATSSLRSAPNPSSIKDCMAESHPHHHKLSYERTKTQQHVQCHQMIPAAALTRDTRASGFEALPSRADKSATAASPARTYCRMAATAPPSLGRASGSMAGAAVARGARKAQR